MSDLNTYGFGHGSATTSVQVRNRVLRNTYALLALSMVPTILGAWIGVATGFSLFAGSPFIGLIIFADEIYDKTLFDGVQHTSIGALSTDVVTVTFNGLSKNYRSCGYRSGWMVVSGDKSGAKDYIEGLNMLSSMRLCANVPGQNAIQTALGGYQSINDLVAEGGRLRRQRDLAWELVTQIPGVTCVKPKAALYLFPKLDPEMYPIENDQEFIATLLREEKVLLVQGSGFNWPHPDHFRIVFLPHEDVLREAIGRLAKFLERYRQKYGKK